MTPPRTRKSAEDRKAQIVATALSLAAEIGPGRLTTDTLAKAVGISQPAIFRHFPRKADIWVAVADHIGAKLQANRSAALKSDKPGAQAIEDFVLGHLRFLQTTPAIPAILFSRELHAENETLRLFFCEMMQQVHKLLCTMITQAKDAGDFAADLDPEQAGFLIMSLIQGLAMRWSLNARGFDLATEGGPLLALQMRAFRA